MSEIELTYPLSGCMPGNIDIYPCCMLTWNISDFLYTDFDVSNKSELKIWRSNKKHFYVFCFNALLAVYSLDM